MAPPHSKKPVARSYPYLSPSDKKIFDVTHSDDGNKLFPPSSHSLYNIQKYSRKTDGTMIPRSMSAIDENDEGWKISFCGVLSTTHIDEKLGEETCLVTKSIANSRSYQSLESTHSSASSKKSLPIPVPRRGIKKRKSNCRSSGGYFFDKYMKRLRAKCTTRKRTRSSCSDSGGSGLDFLVKRDSFFINMKNNREDVACIDFDFSQRMLPRPDTLPLQTIDMEDDDLYPLRFGTSMCWNTEPINQVDFYQSTTSGYSSSSVGHENFIEDVFMQGSEMLSTCASGEHSNIWGDANQVVTGVDDSACHHPLSPASSLPETAKTACCYGDTNSETLKALETLYLCNFRVSINGDWLCLKEICNEASAEGVCIASTIKGG